MSKEELQGNLPFYAWECISLCLENREVDLVIKDVKDMDLILKFLIYHMKTYDNHKDSASKIIDVMVN